MRKYAELFCDLTLIFREHEVKNVCTYIYVHMLRPLVCVSYHSTYRSYREHTHIYVSVSLDIHICVYMYVPESRGLNMCMLYMHACIILYICIYEYIYLYIHICIYACIYVLYTYILKCGD